MSGQDEPNRALLVATRRVPREKFPRKPNNKSFIDQAFSVKVAGYSLVRFLASLWTSTPSLDLCLKIFRPGKLQAISVSVHKHAKK